MWDHLIPGVPFPQGIRFDPPGCPKSHGSLNCFDCHVIPNNPSGTRLDPGCPKFNCSCNNFHCHDFLDNPSGIRSDPQSQILGSMNLYTFLGIPDRKRLCPYSGPSTVFVAPVDATTVSTSQGGSYIVNHRYGSMTPE